MRRVLFLWLAVGLTAPPASAFADEVILTYGDRISGHLVALTRGTVQMETAAAGLIEIQWRYVEQLRTDEARVVELLSGERITGHIRAGPGKTVMIRSPLLGELRVSLENINAILALQQSDDGSHDPAVTTHFESGISPFTPNRSSAPSARARSW